MFCIFGLCFVLLFFLTRTIYPPQSVVEDPRLDLIDLKDDRIENVWKDEEFECLGFQATHGCDPNGPRDFSMDVGCHEKIPRHTAGYCAIRNKTSNEIFHVMKSTCRSWLHWKISHLNCTIAKDFTNFPLLQENYQHVPSLPMEEKMTNKKSKPTRGIILIGYPRAMPGVYAIIRLLRFLGCVLPIEIWIHPKEMSISHSIISHLDQKENKNIFGSIKICTMEKNSQMKHFNSKIYAIYHTKFDQVLFLDSDNIPAKDPTFLFDSKEFQLYGSIFWPDFWFPLNTPFNLHKQSPLWNLINFSFIENMFEQESGQLLIDRIKNQKALNRLMFYTTQQPFLINSLALVYGDKDLFRLAWASTKTPFYFIQHLLMIGGKVPFGNTQSNTSPDDKKNVFFCGTSMIQRDPQGEIVFLHRNGEKLNGRQDQELLMTHLQVFTGGQANSNENILDLYRIHCTSGIYRDFCCHRFYSFHPFEDTQKTIPMQMISLEESMILFLEKKAIEYSIEGRLLLNKQEENQLFLFETKDLENKQQETLTIQQKRLYKKRIAFYGQLFGIVLGIGLLGWKVYEGYTGSTGKSNFSNTGKGNLRKKKNDNQNQNQDHIL
jgi:alpha 1,2-mannosyltransferase